MSTFYEGDQVVEVTTDALHVRKTVEGVDRSVAELTFTIESVTGVPVDCRIVDSLAEGLTDDDLYLHQTDDTARWSITADGGLQFQGVLASRTTVTNRVSVNTSDVRAVEALFREPQVVVSRPMYATQGTADEHTTLDSSGPGGAHDGGATIVLHLSDEQGLHGLSDADTQQLRAALGLESTESVQVKLGHLQQQVAELSAYSDGLEAFIDERGSAQQLLDDLESAHVRLEEECESLRQAGRETDDQLEATVGQLEATNDQLGTTTDRVETLESERRNVARIDRDLVELTAAVTELDARTRAGADDVDARLERVETSLERALEAVRVQLTNVEQDVDELTGLREEVAELAALREEVRDLATLRAEVRELASLQEDVRELASLRAEVAGLEAAVEDGKNWRASFQQAIGTVTSNPGNGEFEKTGTEDTETG